MVEKTIQPGGRGREGEFEPPKRMPITSLSFTTGAVDVFEGQGVNGDVVVIGNRFDRLTSADLGMIFTGEKTRAVSTTMGLHGNNIRQITRYLLEREGPHSRDVDLILHKSVRFNVSMDGPEKKFTIDGFDGDPKVAKAVKVLTDLGVKKEDIKFDRSQFRPTVL